VLNSSTIKLRHVPRRETGVIEIQRIERCFTGGSHGLLRFVLSAIRFIVFALLA